MKSFIAIASSLLLCSCADMVVTKSYTSNTVSRTQVDAKDFGSVETVRYETNCGVAEGNPSAIYIRPFCIDNAIFRGDEAASLGEMPIRKALTPIQFAGDLKEELSKLAPARILKDDEVPRVGWLVEGQFDLVDGGSPVGRFFLGNFGAGRSFLALHVKVTDVEKHRVIYEFDMAGGSRLQGRHGTLRASGLGKATPFDLRNAAERVLLVVSPDPFRFGARSSVTLR
ncbi:MAG: BREX system ATP-binding domain-containing protein [Spartobacteria bacterium]